MTTRKYYVVRVYSHPDILVDAGLCNSPDEVLVFVIRASNNGHYVRVYGDYEKETNPPTKTYE